MLTSHRAARMRRRRRRLPLTAAVPASRSRRDGTGVVHRARALGARRRIPQRDEHGRGTGDAAAIARLRKRRPARTVGQREQRAEASAKIRDASRRTNAE